MDKALEAIEGVEAAAVDVAAFLRAIDRLDRLRDRVDRAVTAYNTAVQESLELQGQPTHSRIPETMDDR